MTILLSTLLFFIQPAFGHVPQGDEFLIRTQPNVPIERLAAAIGPWGKIESRKRGTNVYLVQLKAGADEDRAKTRLAKLPGVHPLLALEEQRELHSVRGLDEKITGRDEDDKDDRGGKGPDTDSPDAAMRWRRLAWVDENGKIAPNAMARAIAQKQKLAQMPHAMVEGDKWIEQGPNNFSGRSRCLVVDPNNPLRIWMGSAGGGIWRSLDGGNTWMPVGDTLPSLAVCALTLDPNDNATLYAGTGEGYFNGDAIAGGGVFKSIDGGTTWTQLPGTANWGWSHINRIAVSPGNPKLLLVTQQYGGVFRSTDGGNTFTNTFGVQSGHAVAFCPTNPNRVIGTVQDYNFSTNQWYAAAIYSTDAGVTWNKATGPLNNLVGFGRIETCPVPSNQNTVYASASDGNVYKSTDGGQSYALVTQNGQSQANWYANDIWVDPTNSNRLVIAGTNVFGSTDGGVTLSMIGSGYIQTEQPHPDVHYLLPAPGYDGVTNKTFYVCTDGGLYTTPDITTASTNSGWSRLDQGARSSQYYSVAGDGPSGRIVGGLQDNGTQSNALGNNQSFYIFGGDGGFVAIDSDDPTYIYGEYIDLEMFRNNDGGTGGNAGWIYGGLGDAGTNANFIAPFILDPNQPQTLLAGGASLWRSTDPRDANPVWSVIRPPGTSLLSAIAVANGNSDVIWVGQNDGGIAMTSNGTSASPTWTTISNASSSSPLPARYVTTILIDPQQSNIVYVTFGGFSSNNVWKTTDGGSTWNPLPGTGNAMLPQVPVRAIARRPGASNVLYVGTEIGLFSTFDGGQTWTTSSDLAVNVSVDQLTYMNHSNTLLAATHGRGIWALPYITESVGSVTFNPTPVVGGNAVTGTVALASAAPPGGILVTLASNSKLVTVPGSVFVYGSALTATFPITTGPVAVPTSVSISATRDTSTVSATLTVNPPSLTELSLSPSTTVGGTASTGTVTLTGPAPAGGFVVALSSGSKLATVASTVTVGAGATTATFPISTFPVATASTATITATVGTATQSATLTIDPPALSGVSFSPSSVVGGTSATGTVSLNGPAPAAGVKVALTSSSANATAPASIKIGAGASSETFAVTTKAVATTSAVTITAVYGTQTEKATLTLQPNVLQQVSISPSTVVGGSQTAVTGTVTFNGPPPSAGEVVTLTSSDAKVVTVPASVKLTGAATSVNFAVTHKVVSVSETVTITATYGGVSQTATLTVTPLQVASILFSPASVVGGSTSTATISLNAAPGSSGAVSVLLTSSSKAIMFPVKVTIPVGSTSAKVTVTTTAVSATASATLAATYGSSSQQGALTIQAPALVSLAVAPSSAKGSSVAVTGTVTISGPAGPGGLVVNLSSSNPSAATVPATVTIAAGKTTATFKVGHISVTSQTVVTLTASLAGTSKTATLTLSP